MFPIAKDTFCLEVAISIMSSRALLACFDVFFIAKFLLDSFYRAFPQ